MDKHERVYRCLHRDCPRLKGFTSAADLRRHQKEQHQMHGRQEHFYCPSAGCTRAEAGRKPFLRENNRDVHVRRSHQKADHQSAATPSLHTLLPRTRITAEEAPNTAENLRAEDENTQLRAKVHLLEQELQHLKNHQERRSRQLEWRIEQLERKEDGSTGV